jgi:hypothetical protein
MTAIRSTVLALVLGSIAVLAVAPASVAAEGTIPPPPARFAGKVTLGGYPAGGGLTVKAYVGAYLCGSSTTYNVVTLPPGSYVPVVETRYVIDVAAASSSTPGCGYNGATVRFAVGSFAAAPLGTWANWKLNNHNLTLFVRYTW